MSQLFIMKRKEHNLFMQAGILAAAGIIVRIIGLLYGSPLTGIIGDEGNGYYSQAYNCYAIMLLISSYSIPSAISKVIAQRLGTGEYRNAQRIFHCALIYVFIIGTAFSLLLYFGAGFFVAGNSVPVLKVFAPTIFFFGILGVLRGYFQAQKTMIPTSVSQILEQIMNAAISLLAAYLFIMMVSGEDETTRAIYGAMGSAVGTGSGVITALVFMTFVYFRQRNSTFELIESDTHRKDSYKSIFKTIILVVTPFILSTFIYNFTTMLDQTIFTNILIGVKGIAEKDVSTAYGIFSRKAVVISNIPIAVASAMSSAMMPSIASSFARGEKTKTGETVKKVIRMTMLIAIPSAVGLMFLCKPITFILYPQRNSLTEASILLAGLSITVVFYSLSTVTNAVLQGIGRLNVPVVNALMSLIVQGAVLFLLLQYTDIGNFALVIALIIYSFLMCVLNGMQVRKSLPYKTDIKVTYWIPFASSLIMGETSYVLYRLLNFAFNRFIPSNYFANLFATAISLIVAVIIYAFCMIQLGGTGEEELLGLPKGAKIVSVLKKFRMLK